MKTPSFVSLPAVLLLSVVALASCGTRGGKPHKGHPQFEGWDTNDDGKLSYPEFSKSSIARKSDRPKATFAKIDANRDGYVSLAELKTYRKAQKAR